MRKTVSAKKIGHKTPLLAHAPNDRMFVVIGRVEINSNRSRKRPHTTHELISIPGESVERSILLIRSQKVILDRTLAKLYGVSTKVLNQRVKRNLERFPQDFVFLLTMEEANGVELTVLRSKNVTFKKPRGKHLKSKARDYEMATLFKVTNCDLEEARLNAPSGRRPNRQCRC